MRLDYPHMHKTLDTITHISAVEGRLIAGIGLSGIGCLHAAMFRLGNACHAVLVLVAADALVGPEDGADAQDADTGDEARRHARLIVLRVLGSVLVSWATKIAAAMKAAEPMPTSP